MNKSEEIIKKLDIINEVGGNDVGKTILKQLGGNKFIAFTGAKNITFDAKNNSLSFKIGRNSSGITHVTVKLTLDDLYDMTFFKIRGTKVKEHTVSGLFFDQLQPTFTEETGLNTHL